MTRLWTGQLRLTARGPAHLDEVWARYTHLARWTGWAPHLRDVEYPRDVIVPGTAGRVRGLGLAARFRIDSLDEETHTWAWTVQVGPLRVTFDHGVDGEQDGSTAWVVIHAPWPIAVGYAPIARYALGRLVAVS